MTYLEQLQAQEFGCAYDELRPDFRDHIFPEGADQAREMIQELCALLFPGTDCLTAHFRTGLDFYITYAFTRLMGYNAERAETSCKCKYGTLPPLVFGGAIALCQAQLARTFPDLDR